MILDTVAIKLNSPDNLFINPTYPSGVMPEQKPIYTFGYPSSDYPVVILPQKLFDEARNSICDGYYSVALSDDKKFLLLIQSNVLKAKVPVYKLVETELTPEETSEETNIKAKIEKAKLAKKLKKSKEFERELKDFYTRQKAKMSAEIFDSGQGYYIIKYWKHNQRAWGAISK